MAETLVIRLPEDPDASWEWVVVNRDGRPTSEVTSGFLVEAGPLAEHRRVYAFAPATRVLRTSVQVPIKNPAKIRQALPYALEEMLAGNVETQHFAAGKRDSDGRVPVAVVAIDLLDEWLQELNQAGLNPDAIFSESDGLAPVPSTISVLIDQHRVIICDPEGHITVADPESLQAVLELQLDLYAEPDLDPTETTVAEAGALEPEMTASAAESEKAGPVNLLVYCNDADYEAQGVLWDMLRLRTDSLEIKIMPDGSLARLASQVVSGGGVNLLQGDYAQKSEMNVHWREWRTAAMLVAGLTALLLANEGAQYWKLNQQEASLDEAALTMLRTTYGETGDDSDPWGQLQARLGNVETETTVTGPGFEDAIETLSVAFQATPGIEIEALNYRAGSLDLQLLAPDVNTLDQLRQRIAAPGRFSAEIQSANPDDEQIKGRMKISSTESVS